MNLLRFILLFFIPILVGCSKPKETWMVVDKFSEDMEVSRFWFAPSVERVTFIIEKCEETGKERGWEIDQYGKEPKEPDYIRSLRGYAIYNIPKFSAGVTSKTSQNYNDN